VTKPINSLRLMLAPEAQDRASCWLKLAHSRGNR
jgi:hypothetical protein